ncbi:metallophosphoesterase [Anaeromicrobium sediminis]|nr:metallophosphoesterase [Anaeromicrobium sediminis]
MIIFLGIYGAINFFVGRYIFNFANLGIIQVNKYIFWILFWITAFSFIISRFGHEILPRRLANIFLKVGSYWMALLFYMVLLLGIVYMFLLINKGVKIIPQDIINSSKFAMRSGILIVSTVIVICTIGYINANNLKVINYNVKIPKSAGDIKKLNAIMISDVHLGVLIDKEKLEKIVEKVNGENPDIIFICGDLVDEDISPILEHKMGEVLEKLKSKYGTYFVMGNHEYIGRKDKEIIEELKSANINVLVDEVTKVDNSFYVVGRDDLASGYIKGTERKSLDELTKGIDKSLPIIVLDHQPKELEEAKNIGADMQLSGHTHRGQMFPNNFITQRVYEVDWGHVKKDNLNVIVSSGVGTWGPPIRFGTNAEIVKISMDFK